MSSQSDNRLSPEELKRRNGLPPDTLETQTETVPVAHPTAEEWQELRGMLWSVGELLGTQAVLLEELAQRLPTLPYSEQTRDMARELTAIRALLEQEARKQEQAGRKNGRRFSLPWSGIPLAPFESGWLLLPLGLALLLGLLLMWARLWSGLSVLFM